jgi:hypothetical protein
MNSHFESRWLPIVPLNCSNIFRGVHVLMQKP